MADQPLTKQKKTARAKGLAALGSAGTTVLITMMAHWMFLVPGVPITAYLTYKWLKYRAEWGMRF